MNEELRKLLEKASASKTIKRKRKYAKPKEQ